MDDVEQNHFEKVVSRGGCIKFTALRKIGCVGLSEKEEF